MSKRGSRKASRSGRAGTEQNKAEKVNIIWGVLFSRLIQTFLLKNVLLSAVWWWGREWMEYVGRGYFGCCCSCCLINWLSLCAIVCLCYFAANTQGIWSWDNVYTTCNTYIVKTCQAYMRREYDKSFGNPSFFEIIIKCLECDSIEFQIWNDSVFQSSFKLTLPPSPSLSVRAFRLHFSYPILLFLLAYASVRNSFDIFSRMGQINGMSR